MSVNDEWQTLEGHPISFPLFFFQAEDGIRDVAVTGVQTCALPIWNQYRRSSADGLFPLQWLERKFLRHPSRPGARRRRIFHRIENRHRALVAPGDAQVLVWR